MASVFVAVRGISTSDPTFEQDACGDRDGCYSTESLDDRIKCIYTPFGRLATVPIVRYVLKRQLACRGVSSTIGLM